MNDMLILAAPVVVVALWCLLLLFVMLRKWKMSLVLLIISSAFNWYTEQIPVNVFHRMKTVLTDKEKRFPAVKKKGVIRVLNYNICGKEEFAPRHGQEFIDYVLGLDADILFLPENNFDTAPRLDSILKARYPYYMQQFEYGSQWVGEHTLYSRYPLSKPRFYKIDLPKLIREKPELDSLYLYRIGDKPFFYEAEADINGTPVTLLHIHMRSNSYDMAKADGSGRREKMLNVYENLLFGYTYRDFEAKMLRDTLRDNPNPLLICGDFNDLSGSNAMRILQRCREENIHKDHRERLKNAWWEKGFGLGFTFADQHLRLRLDHILYSREFDLLDVTIPKVSYSDHRPMIADFEFNPD